MQAIKLEILVIDHDGLGVVGVIETIENARYPNHCISPSVMTSKAVDIGEWRDDHPFNNSRTSFDEFKRVFVDN